MGSSSFWGRLSRCSWRNKRVKPVECGTTLLGTYQVLEGPFGGAMGRVFRVRHLEWDVDLAMKQPGESALGDAAYRAAFLRECETWIDLGLHEQIVSCYYVREIDGVPSVFAEWMDGGNLHQKLATGALSREGGDASLLRILDIAIQIARGLGFAHTRGLIHQDVKPDNILFAADGTAKVTDFGISGVCVRPETDKAEQCTASLPGELRCKSAPGTQKYCSSEQKRGGDASIWTDLWGFAVTLLELLLGDSPWTDGEVAGLSCEHYLSDIGDFAPEELKALLRRCFRPDEPARPKDFFEVERILCGVYATKSGSEYPRRRPVHPEAGTDALSNRALSFLDLGCPDQAEALWQSAQKADPLHMPSVYNRSLYRWRSAKIDDLTAMRDIQNCFNGNPCGATAELFARFLSERQTSRAVLQLRTRYKEEAAFRGVPFPDTDADACVRLCARGAHALAVDPEGGRCVIAFEDRALELWEPADQTCLAVLERRGEWVNALDFRGGLIAAACEDNALRLYDASGGFLRRLAFAEGAVERVRLLPERNAAMILLSRAEDGQTKRYVMLVDLESGEWREKLRSLLFEKAGFCALPDGQRFVSSSGAELYVCDLESGEPVQTFSLPEGEVSCAAVDAAGVRLLAGSSGGDVLLFSLEGEVCVRRFCGHTGGVTVAAFHPSGQLAMSAGQDGTARIWDVSSGRCLRSFTAQKAPILCAALCMDGRAMVTSGWNNAVLLQYVPAFSYRADWQICRIVPLAGQLALRERFDQTLARAKAAQDAGDRSRALELLGEAAGISGFAQDPAYLNRNAALGETLTIVGIRSAWTKHIVSIGDADVRSILFAPDADRMLTVEAGGRIRFWNIEAGDCVAERQLPCAVNGAAASASILALAGADGTVRILRADDCSERCVCRGHAAAVSAVACSKDGNTVLSAGWDHTLRVFGGDGACRAVCVGHTSSVSSVALSADGTIALSGGWDHSVRIWRTQTGQCLRVLSHQGDCVSAVAIAPRAGLGASGSWDGAIVLFDLETGTVRARLAGTVGAVTALRFTRDGAFVVSAGSDGIVRLWRAATGELETVITGHTGAIHALDSTADSRFFLTAGADGVARLLQIDYIYGGVLE